ncbi:MAG TPA: 2-phosphosulfolactate phosphatase [Gemmatirosa sp.]|nr:2-phosphosulfolactate phosphatase [Gemmatirosa sp.]
MRIDVLFGAASVVTADVAGRVVAVIDVLRASTTIAVALANGARSVIPFEGPDEAVLRSKHYDRREVLLAGERRMRALPGFDLGNSPREFSREAVDGRTILFATTNGTPALLATQGARDVIVSSYVNLAVSLAFLRTAARGGADLTIVCAGSERQFGLEDAACAGRLVRGVRKGREVTMNDAAHACVLLDRHYGDQLETLFQDAAHGRALAEAGFGEDLALCAQIDAYAVLPVFADRQIGRLGETR